MPLNRMRDKGLPDVADFSVNPEEVLARLTARYEAAYQAETGEPVTLAAGNKIRIWLSSMALEIYLLESLIRYMASQNFLACASGEYLDHIAATRGGPKRAGATCAVVTMQFVFSVPAAGGYVVPKGTRVTPNGTLFFVLENACVVPAGAQSWEQVFRCQTSGTAGNGFLKGQIATLVDPLPFVQGVANLDASQGGADVQGDDDFAELIYLAPEGFAVAGPQMAYEYLAKGFSPAVMDARAYSNAPGEVTVVTLLQGGELPQPAFLSELLSYLSARERRPLTDSVHAAAPEVVHYDIAFTWYLEAGQGDVQEVQANVEQAVDDYIAWQRARMGRDVTPQELIGRVRAAGAKRLVVAFPADIPVAEYAVAVAGVPVITFGGVEHA